MEHIGDIIDGGLMAIAKKKISNQIQFSEAGLAEISKMHQVVCSNFELAVNTYISGDSELAHQLEALFIGFGARVGVVNTAQAGHLVGQLLGELGTRDIAGRVGEVTHLENLVAHGVGDALASVTDVNRPHATGNGIEIFTSILIFDAHALAFDDNHGIGGLIRLVLHQVMPQMVSVATDNVVNVLIWTCQRKK